MNHPKGLVCRALLRTFLWGVVVCTPGVAEAATTTFSAAIDGETRKISLELFDADGVSYVSMRALVNQAGGACVVSPAQVSIDFPDASAVIGINSNDVIASRASFSLDQPVLPFENDALIAESDVGAFFDQAFAMTLSKQQSDGAAQMVATPIEPEEDADLLGEAIAPRAAAQSTGRPSAMNPIQKIILDPGHGGEDPGVTGPGGGSEKAIVLAVARRLATLLREDVGVEVALTREEDRGLTKADRLGFAAREQGGLYIGLHTAASPSPQSYGLDIFAASRSSRDMDYGPMSRYIGEIVAQALAEAADAEIRAPRNAPLKILGDLAMPGILIELGYLSNPSEEALLLSETHQNKLAVGIAEGIRQVIAAYENAP